MAVPENPLIIVIPNCYISKTKTRSSLNGFLISKNLDYASKGIIETNDLSPAFF